MLKDHDRWNEYKKALDSKTRLVNFHEREIWWCSVGINIGSEQDSYADDFARPVLIVKKFTNTIFWALPLTSTIKKEDNRVTFQFDGNKNDALILHMRALDCRRLINKKGTVHQIQFEIFLNSIISQLLTIKSTETPSEGVSKAEADVMETTSFPRMFSIKDQRILSTFFGDRYLYRLAISTRM